MNGIATKRWETIIRTAIPKLRRIPRGYFKNKNSTRGIKRNRRIPEKCTNS
jgi:hypothetical protein